MVMNDAVVHLSVETLPFGGFFYFVSIRYCLLSDYMNVRQDTDPGLGVDFSLWSQYVLQHKNVTKKRKEKKKYGKKIQKKGFFSDLTQELKIGGSLSLVPSKENLGKIEKIENQKEKDMENDEKETFLILFMGRSGACELFRP